MPADSQSLKEKVKSHVDVLLQDFFDDTDLLRILPNVALQVVKDINQYLRFEFCHFKRVPFKT